MDKVTLSARILLGLAFVVFGVNGFYEFLPKPEHSPAAGNFLAALVNSGYQMDLVKITEIVCGLLLVTGQFVPLALVVLAPLMVNILAFHIYLEMRGIELALTLLAIQLFLVARHWQSVRSVLQRQPSYKVG